MAQGKGNPILEERACKGGEKGSDEWRGAGARLVQEEFALRSGRIGGATGLAAKMGPEAVLQTEGRRPSESFMVYARANVEVMGILL